MPIMWGDEEHVQRPHGTLDLVALAVLAAVALTVLINAVLIAREIVERLGL